MESVEKALGLAHLNFDVGPLQGGTACAEEINALLVAVATTELLEHGDELGIRLTVYLCK